MGKRTKKILDVLTKVNDALEAQPDLFVQEKPVEDPKIRLKKALAEVNAAMADMPASFSGVRFYSTSGRENGTGRPQVTLCVWNVARRGYDDIEL